MKSQEQNEELRLSLREIQQVELGILLQFNRFCKKHQLRWWLDWGSLIGVLRHRGFIPWDNDIDVGMPLQDYRRLIELARMHPDTPLEEPEFLLSHCYTDEHAQFPYIKIFDRRTRVIQHDLRNDINCQESVWVDIFPVANCLEDEHAQQAYSDQLWKLERAHLICTIKHYSSRNWLVALAKKLQEPWIRRKGYRFYLQAIVEMQFNFPQDLEENGKVFNFSTRNISPLRAEHFTTLEQGYFEGRQFPIPTQAEKLLGCYYGDWKTLPTEEERITHDIDAYWRSSEDKQAWYAKELHVL